MYALAQIIGILKCNCCNKRSLPLWDRRSKDNTEHQYYCSNCLLEAHQQIKHTIATARRQELTRLGNLAASISIIQSFCDPIYGLSPRRVTWRVFTPVGVPTEGVVPAKKLESNTTSDVKSNFTVCVLRWCLMLSVLVCIQAHCTHLFLEIRFVA